MKYTYIVRDGKILDGVPVIAGTRIPAERLKWLLKHGYTEKNLVKEFPHVPKAKIRGALSELVSSSPIFTQQDGYEAKNQDSPSS